MDPGIRFVLFMQGCPLHCKYCHNVDAIARCGGKDYTPEQMISEVVKYKTYFDLSGGINQASTKTELGLNPKKILNSL